MIFFEGDIIQDNTDAPQGLLIVACRPVARLQSKQAHTREIEHIVHEEIYCTTKELNTFTNSFMQKPEQYIWKWI